MVFPSLIFVVFYSLRMRIGDVNIRQHNLKLEECRASSMIVGTWYNLKFSPYILTVYTTDWIVNFSCSKATWLDACTWTESYLFYVSRKTVTHDTQSTFYFFQVWSLCMRKSQQSSDSFTLEMSSSHNRMQHQQHRYANPLDSHRVPVSMTSSNGVAASTDRSLRGYLLNQLGLQHGFFKSWFHLLVQFIKVSWALAGTSFNEVDSYSATNLHRVNHQVWT